MFAQATDTADHQQDVFGERTLYDIPEANFAKFEKEMAKLSRRSERLIGLPIRPIVFSYKMVPQGNGVSTRVMEVYLTAETPVLEGWTFVARIDHTNETGNIIRTVPNLSCELPDSFRTSAPDCDHCKVRRQRRDTFVVWNAETGAFQQVGTTCLTDFFGHDPYKIAKLAEMLGYANDVASAAREPMEQAALQERRWINLEEYLAHTASVVQQYGWVSMKTFRENGTPATRTRSFNSMATRQEDLTAADYALADRALEWARSLSDKPTMTDFEHNVSVVANSPYMEERSMGIAAAIVGIFHQNERRSQGLNNAVEVGSLDGLMALFAKAKDSALKFPKISLRLPNGQPVVLAVAGAQSKAPGTINVTDGGPFGSNKWFGRVTAEGKWEPSRQVTADDLVSVKTLLTAMAVDAAATAAEYGRLTGHCCFCRIGLTDKRSTEVGYGKTCAANYGLPWGK